MTIIMITISPGRGKRGSTTMTAPETPYVRDEERPPPGGKQSVTLGRASLASVANKENTNDGTPAERKPAAGTRDQTSTWNPDSRPPPGGLSQISFG